MWEQLAGTLCILCRQRFSGDRGGCQLCRHCHADLPWLAEPELAPAAPASPLQRQLAALAYTDTPRAWVLQAKKDRGLVAARVLGILLTELLLHAYPISRDRPDLLIPMPLSTRRLMARGHNQAVLIAGPISRRLGIHLDRSSVRRRRHTALQPGLDPAGRIANVAGAFYSRRTFDAMSVAIIDDVVTTGASAESLARVLLAANAREVHLWCPTRATWPNPNEDNTV